jgi:hypothetical protein
MKIKCQTCNEIKTEFDFRYTEKNGTIYFNVGKCKKCLSEGKNTYNKKVLPLDITGKIIRFFGQPKQEERLDLKRDIYLLLKRIEINKGNVDETDCVRLLSLYTEKYGDKITNLDREYEMIYYYQKLKECNGKRHTI